MEKVLNFSEPFINAEYISYDENYRIDRKSIVINLDLDPVIIDDVELTSLKSVVCADTTIDRLKNALVFTMPNEKFQAPNTKVDLDIIRNGWQHIYDLTNAEHLKKTDLWRSEKTRIGRLELNLWFALPGTDCGIHNGHGYLETHTQIYGIGRMQKFRTRDAASLYQEVYMAPGFSHDPFYSNTGKYPWHQYHADTECIWLAIEEHPE